MWGYIHGHSVYLFLLGLALLTVAYELLRIYACPVRREWPEKVYYERRVDGDVKGRYDDYIAQGMNDYEYSLKRKLLWLVYILPVGVILVLVWLSFRG